MAVINVQESNEPKANTEIKTGQDSDTGQPAEQQSYLGPWKSKEAAEEGFANMKKLMDQQGNELGMLRKQTEYLMNQGQQSQQPQPQRQEQGDPAPDYGKELKNIEKQIQELDPDEPDYNRNLAKLITQSNQIASRDATQRALSAAQEEFRRELDDRDVQTMHKNFYRDNPDFDTPGMQMRIQEYLQNDQTGMSDPVVAYREIQRDDAMAKVAEYEQQLAEKERLLQLKAGEEATGKVVTKGQSPGQKTKQPKAQGADLDKGMLDAWNSAA